MSEVSIDVDYLAAAPLKSILRFAERKKHLAKNGEKLQAAIRDFQAMLLELEDLDIEPGFDFQNGCIDLSFAGDGDKLGNVWHVLRRAGFEPDKRPQKGDTSFCTFWRNGAHAMVWVSFTSTMCRRVQVGTKMVEQPIYETVCGDLPELDAPQNAVVTAEDVF